MSAKNDTMNTLAALFTVPATGASAILWVTEANKNPVFLGSNNDYFNQIRATRTNKPGEYAEVFIPGDEPIYYGAPGTYMLEAKNAALAEKLCTIIRSAFSAQGIDPNAAIAGDMGQDGTHFSPNSEKAKGKNLLLDLQDNTAEKIAAIGSVRSEIEQALADEQKKRFR